MENPSDQQLLRDYCKCQTECAFTELVQRHIDFVYSASLRMVHDAHLAQDVTQAVFIALAQNAGQLTDHPVLSGWLHRTAQNLAVKAVRSDVRRRAREEEAAAMNDLHSAPPNDTWEHIAPHLDAALNALGEADRDAILLRYFERKSAREIAQVLAVSEEAAQKRVSRAVERLRGFLENRRIAVGASGLGVLLSANAIQSAPAGLGLSISTAASLAGTTIATSTTATLIKAITMTTLQKTLIAATLVTAVGTGIFEARQNSQLRGQVQALLQQQVPLSEQLQQLQQEHKAALDRAALLTAQVARIKSDNTELLRLRGEVARLRGVSQELAKSKADAGTSETGLDAKAQLLKQKLEQTPEAQIPELNLTLLV